MAPLVFVDCYVLLNAVNVSDHVKSATLNFMSILNDDTVMTKLVKSNKPGLFDWSLDVELLNDYAAASIDATLFPLVGAAAFAWEVRPTSGARSTSNPGYTSTGVLANYNPIDAKVGELAATKVSLKPAGVALTRNTV